MQVDYLPYMDQLGAEIGVVPSPAGQLLRCRPRLAWRLLFGPAIPAQFRLQGPHPWKHASNFIVHAQYPAGRVHSALRKAVWVGALALGAAGALGAALLWSKTQ